MSLLSFICAMFFTGDMFDACYDWDNSTITRTEVAEISEIVFDDPEMAVCIAERESSFITDAVSDTDDVGLFQINRAWYHEGVDPWNPITGHLWPWLTDDLLFNPYVNAIVAKMILERSSWEAWHTHGLCD